MIDAFSTVPAMGAILGDTSQPIDAWIESVRNGNNRAFEEFWASCIGEVLVRCRRKLCYNDRCICYEDDLASEVMISIWKELCDHRSMHFRTRSDLWVGVLRTIDQLSINRFRFLNRKKRLRIKNPRNVACENPELIHVDLQESWCCYVASLDSEKDRKIAAWIANGYESADIAIQVGLSRRSSQRRVASIRRRWGTFLGD